MVKIGHDAWAIAHKNGQFGSKIKNVKKVQKRLYYHIKVVVSKKTLQKTPIIREMTAF